MSSSENAGRISAADKLIIDAAMREVFGEAACFADQALPEKPESPDTQTRDGNGDADALRRLRGPRELPHPDHIGQFHLKRRIASGGMGTVYEATQTHPRRTVAIKVMKYGAASKRSLRRFEYEAQVLARLQHPSIAHVYEAGWHDEGGERVPFFVLEYIPGARSIIEWARHRNLSTRERVSLFVDVCEAVHHGHQRGVIHRDLKPGNVLVDSRGAVKIIDFGVARCTDSDLATTTQQTMVGEMVGTLRYMSPEQCEADPHDLDIRSDIYSLGVLMFELLTGEMPYDLRSGPVAAIPGIICEQPPTRLGAIDRALRGDLETIVGKSLEKDRRRRYQSALALAEDLRKFLDKRPIEARPPSAVYRLRKLVQRRKGPFATAAAIGLIAFVGGASMARQYVAKANETERELHTLRELSRLEAELRLLEEGYSVERVDPSPAQRRRLLKIADDVLALDANNAKAYALRAKVRVLDENYALALPDCEKALRIDPSDILALRTCAWIAQNEGDFQPALEQYEKAMNSYAYLVDLPRDFYNRGRMRRLVGDYDGAIADFQIAAQLADDTHKGRPLRQQAVTRYMAGDVEGALKGLASAAEYLGDKVVTLYLRVWEIHRLRDAPGDREAAQVAWEKAEAVAAYQPLAQLFVQYWRGEIGEDEYIKRLPTEDDRAQGYYYLGVRALVDGDKKKATEHFQRVVSAPTFHRWPEYDVARWHLQRLARP